VQVGDKLTLIREAEDEGWYVARDERGKEGLVPTTHISMPGASVPASLAAPQPPSVPSAPPPASVPPPPASKTITPQSASQAPSAKPPTAAVAKFPYKASGEDELTFAVRTLLYCTRTCARLLVCHCLLHNIGFSCSTLRNTTQKSFFYLHSDVS
jgi:hypothetical protein